MGGVKKAFKKVFRGVGSIIGLGGGSDVATPTVEKVDPAPTSVTTDDVSADTDSNTKKKKRRGFATTQTSSLAAGGETGTRDTLG